MDFQDQLSLNAGQKYCRMLQWEHSAILSTCIELVYHMALRPLFCLFLSGRLRQVSLYVFKDVLSVNDNYDDKLMIFVVIG